MNIIEKNVLKIKNDIMKIKKIENKEDIEFFLLKDKYWCVEAFIGLREENFILADWYGAYDSKNKLVSIYLIFRCLSPLPIFTFGQIQGLNLIIDKLDIKTDIYIQSSFKHIDYLLDKFQFNNDSNTILMYYKNESNIKIRSDDEVVSLSMNNYNEMEKLYSTSENQMYFDKEHIRKGLYFGIKNKDSIISMAGTHILNNKNKIAMLGDIVTHPNFRKRGYALKCCNMLTNHLSNLGFDVCIKVKESNISAINMYKSLNFIKKECFYEGLGESVISNQ